MSSCYCYLGEGHPLGQDQQVLTCSHMQLLIQPNIHTHTIHFYSTHNFIQPSQPHKQTKNRQTNIKNINPSFPYLENARKRR